MRLAGENAKERTMSAYKNFLLECAEAGKMPVSDETFAMIDDLECDHDLDWIGYCEHDYVGHDGQLYVHECISMETARRLVAEGFANVEIEGFVKCFGEFCPA